MCSDLWEVSGMSQSFRFFNEAFMNEVHSFTCYTREKGMIVETNAFIDLHKENYVSLTTFRRTGEAVVTPVWFAESKGVIYVATGVHAGKVKRIRHSERVTLAACTIRGIVKGAEVEGKAYVVSEPEEIHAAETALARKYGLTRSIYYFLLNVPSIIQCKPRINQAYIAIESADL